MDEKELRHAAWVIMESINVATDDLPSAEDRLFVSDTENRQFNACLDEYGDDHAYRTGFEDAAKILARVALFSTNQIDALVYPIVYNYRHHLELQLKHLVRLGAEFTNGNLDGPAQDALGNHNLIKLWKLFEPSFRQMFDSNDDVDAICDGVETQIREIHDIDPNSTAFRYHRQRKLPTASLEGWDHIDLLTFCSNVEKLTSLLGGVESQLIEAIDVVVEQRRECFE